MPKSLESLIIRAALGSCILFQIGCTDSADHVGPWDLEGDIPDTPFLPGIYEAEFEIINDGCEPSLNDIFDKVEGWPPPRVFVFYDTLSWGHRVIAMPIFSWRDGESRNASTRAFEDFVPYSEHFWSEEWPTLPSTFNYLNCSMEDLYREPDLPLRRAEVSLSAPNTVEVLITNDWGHIQECVSEEAREVFKTIPHADCHESYKTTYRLVEACILPCESPLLGLEGGTKDGYPYLKYDRPPSCQCD